MAACYESLTGLQLKTGIAPACDCKIKIGLVTRGLFTTENLKQTRAEFRAYLCHQLIDYLKHT